jgi:hypothetical protein
VLGDLTTISRDLLAELMFGCDAVVFAAGAPDVGTRAADVVDGDGLVLAAEAAVKSDVRRFLHVSAFPNAWRDRRMPAEFEHYMRVKRSADVYLAGTDLDWVIVRPGTLSDERGTGRVHLGPAVHYGNVSRDNVAAVFAALVHAPDVTRQIIELTNGDTPIADAVDSLTSAHFLPERAALNGDNNPVAPTPVMCPPSHWATGAALQALRPMQSSVPLQKRQEGIQVLRGSHRVQNEVEAFRMPCHFLGIAGHAFRLQCGVARGRCRPGCPRGTGDWCSAPAIPAVDLSQMIGGVAGISAAPLPEPPTGAASRHLRQPLH